MAESYFIDSDKLYNFPPDSLLTTDEWEILRGRLADELRYIDYEDVDQYYLSRGLPFLRSFEISLEKKLILEGFKKEAIRDEIWLKGAAYSRRADYDNPETAAALAGLLSFRKLKDILISNGKADKNAVRIFLYSLEAIINLFRAGAAPELARTQARTIENSKFSRDLKKELLHACLKQIFDKYTKTPKTLGGVWSKIDLIKTIFLDVDGVTKKYNVALKNDSLLFTGAGLKKPLKYAKSSIRPFIKAFK